MAFTLIANFEPTSDGHALWRLKEALVAAGWSVAASGNGTGGNFNAAGDVHAPGGTYAGSLDLSTAWMRLRAPVAMSPRREYLLQRPNTTHGVWRCWYSSDGTGFTGGAPSASARPTAADEQGVFNTPTGTTNWFNHAAQRQYRCDYLIGDSSEGFSFYFQGREIGGNVASFAFMLDVLLDPAGADTDPAVTGAAGFDGTERSFASESLNLFSITDSQTASCMHGWYQKGGGAPAWVNYPPNLMGGQFGFTNDWDPIGTNNPPSADQNGRMPSFPVTYARGGSAMTTQKGWKGRSRLFRYEMERVGMRPYSDKTRWILGCLSIPWDGSTDMVI